ncbi:MAG: helix-turn-helix domain-containing protein [Rhodospirillaceae bacterium]|nr:helix-turn-helix domain-containing protein [Rhodospirillaceae bacterium]
MAFGRWIRAQRERAEIPLNEFARQLGISPAYWSRIERELEKAPKDELIEKACKLLNLDKDQAFIQAKRLPPDVQKDLATAVRAYRQWKKDRP